MLQLCRAWGKNIIQHEKVCDDIKFLLCCKKEGLLPLFAIPKLSINGNWYLKWKIAKLIIETEIRNKHKKDLNMGIHGIQCEISGILSFVIFQAVKYNVGNRRNHEKMKWLVTHERK